MAIKSLKQDNSTVVMNRVDYDDKINTLLSDMQTYQPLQSDPSSACERKLKSILSRMKDRTPDSIYRVINTTDGNTPRLYGIPKLHKPGVPMRPIVSFIGSPTYQLSKYLCHILSPLVGNTTHHLRNTEDWTKLASTLKLTPQEEMVSFDVVSLFTSVPTDIAVSTALKRLEDHETLRERTQLTPKEIASLLSFCLGATELQFQGRFYRQIHGTAMGSPVSVVIADLVMEELESKALSSYHSPPRVFKRYVDDTVCIIAKDQINSFHSHLNRQNSHISFTVERYSDNGLPFLDTLNKVLDDGSVDVTIYRKKTHTDRYLCYDSHHAPQHKVAVVRTLYCRAEKLLNNEEHKTNEKHHLHSVLQANGYPGKFIDRHKTCKPKTQTEEDSQPTKRGFAVLPYIKGTTEKIQRVLRNHQIKTAVKPVSTLRQILSKPKDPIPREKKTGVIYQIPCKECNAVYIGETKRALKTRQKEHMDSVRRDKAERSALAEHTSLTGHDVNWSDTKIIGQESDWARRKWLEALKITSNKNSLSNRDSGRVVPDNYKPLLGKS